MHAERVLVGVELERSSWVDSGGARSFGERNHRRIARELGEMREHGRRLVGLVAHWSRRRRSSERA